MYSSSDEDDSQPYDESARIRHIERCAEGINIKRQTITMPVSTRGIGFYLQNKFIDIYNNLPRFRKSLNYNSIYHAYRVSLAQFEYRLSQNGWHPGMIFTRTLANVEHSYNFDFIINTITAVCKMDYREITYVFGIPKGFSGDTFIPMPHNVCYSNLQQTVEALSNDKTPREIRLHFYNCNPLPAARWGPRGHFTGNFFAEDEWGDINKHDSRFPILLNHRDFWPENYERRDSNYSGLNQDIQEFNKLLSVDNFHITPKMLGSVCSLPGQKVAFVSNFCTDARNPELIYNENHEIDWGASITKAKHVEICVNSGLLNRWIKKVWFWVQLFWLVRFLLVMNFTQVQTENTWKHTLQG